MKLLLECGADPNVENDMAGATALDAVEEFMAWDEASEQDKKMMELLLKHGALSYEQRMRMLIQEMNERHELGDGGGDDEEKE